MLLLLDSNQVGRCPASAASRSCSILGGAINSTNVTFACIRQRLQQAATNIGPESEVVSASEKLDGTTSTQVSHALHLAASSFNGLLEKRRDKWGGE